jgi:hypothetical protein
MNLGSMSTLLLLRISRLEDTNGAWSKTWSHEQSKKSVAGYHDSDAFLTFKLDGVGVCLRDCACLSCPRCAIHHAYILDADAMQL